MSVLEIYIPSYNPSTVASQITTFTTRVGIDFDITTALSSVTQDDPSQIVTVTFSGSISTEERRIIQYLMNINFLNENTMAPVVRTTVTSVITSPTLQHDEKDGYLNMSTIYNPILNRIFTCLDATEGSANWVHSGISLGSPLFSINTTYTNGQQNPNTYVEAKASGVPIIISNVNFPAIVGTYTLSLSAVVGQSKVSTGNLSILRLTEDTTNTTIINVNIPNMVGPTQITQTFTYTTITSPASIDVILVPPASDVQPRLYSLALSAI